MIELIDVEPLKELAVNMSDDETKRLLDQIISNQNTGYKAQESKLNTLNDSVSDLSEKLSDHITDDERAQAEVREKLNNLELDLKTRFAKLEGMKLIAVPVIFGLGTLAMWALKSVFGGE